MAADRSDKPPSRELYGDTLPTAGEALATDPAPPPVLATEPEARVDLDGTAETDLAGCTAQPVDPAELLQQLGETVRDQPAELPQQLGQTVRDQPRREPPARFFDAPTELGPVDAVAPQALAAEQLVTVRDPEGIEANVARPVPRPSFHDQPTQLRDDATPAPASRRPAASSRDVEAQPADVVELSAQPTLLKRDQRLHEETTALEVAAPPDAGAPTVVGRKSPNAPRDARAGRRDAQVTSEPTDPASGTVTVEPLARPGRNRGRLLLYGVGGALLLLIVAAGVLLALRPKPQALVPGTALDHGPWQLLLYGAEVVQGKQGASTELRLRLRVRRSGQVVRPEQLRLLLHLGGQLKQPSLLERAAKNIVDDGAGTIWRLAYPLPEAAAKGELRLRFAPADDQPLELSLPRVTRR
jgi:hypothetical protein